MTTNDEIISKLPKDEQDEIFALAELEIQKHGGRRAGAGRKPKTGNVLQFRMRVSEQEKNFINYAREHHLNFDELMEG